MEQRSNEWFNARLGRFTAYNINDLMGVKGLGTTGETLAFKKAKERLFGIDETWNVETWDMKRGKESEPKAFELAKTILAQRFLKVKATSFFPLGDDSGASPDGLVGKDSTLEIKCPNADKFFKIVAFGIEALDDSWIDQMQLQMKCTHSKKCFFFAYVVWKGEELYHILEVERNEERIEKIMERISEAVVLRDTFIEQLKTNKQF